MNASLSRGERRDLLSAPGRVVCGQAGQLIEQPGGGQDFQQSLHLGGADQPRRDDQVEVLGGQRDEVQVIGAGSGLAGDARVGQPGGDGRGQVQVPGRAGVVSG